VTPPLDIFVSSADATPRISDSRRFSIEIELSISSPFSHSRTSEECAGPSVAPSDVEASRHSDERTP
jgi:hypothetical protein